tara:strand:+ start:1981 stop:3420 length:1440 start_codon:yes stop_codon:yes gene_type:complete
MQVKNVVIVGGGSAGWMTAACLAHESHVNVTLVDKEIPTPLGVGEATLLSFEKFMNQNCGFDSNEFLAELDAGLKAGILFKNWGYTGNEIWLPFYWLNYPFSDPPVSMIDAWSTAQNIDFKKLEVLYQTSMSNIIDRTQLGAGYAVHIDCIKLVEYIQNKIKDKITYINAAVKELGNTTLYLKNGDKIEGDLFIDCTGARKLLGNSSFDRVTLSDRLYVNTAVAGPIQYEDRDIEFTPYTTTTAVDQGWIWNTPLQSRIGSGLVFNKDITDVDEAKIHFCNFWNNRIREDELKVIDWTPYYEKAQWDRNVVSIGLSAGFIEPLESTGLGLIIEAIKTLSKLLNDGYCSQYDKDYFNSRMISSYEQCIDYVNSHYSASDIDSPFWNYVRKNYKMSEALETYLKEMTSENQTILPGGKGFIFGVGNWVHWLVQAGYPLEPRSWMAHETMESSLNHLIDCEDRKIELGNDLITHNRFCEMFL